MEIKDFSCELSHIIEKLNLAAHGIKCCADAGTESTDIIFGASNVITECVDKLQEVNEWLYGADGIAGKISVSAEVVIPPVPFRIARPQRASQ